MKINKDLTNTEYRQAGGISASDIKDILANPYLFKIGYKPERTAQAQARLDLGRAIHCLILEAHHFERDFAIMPELNLRTKEGKESHAKLLANEKRILISQKDYELSKEISQLVLDTNLYNFSAGLCEASIFSEFEGVKVKCRPDCFWQDKGVIVDIKTTRNGGNTPDEFQKQVANFGYYIQASFYMLITGAKEFFFLAVDIDTKTIGIYELDFVSLEFGLSEIKRAIGIYKNINNISHIVSKDFVNETFSRVITLPNYVFYKNGANL